MIGRYWDLFQLGRCPREYLPHYHVINVYYGITCKTYVQCMWESRLKFSRILHESPQNLDTQNQNLAILDLIIKNQNLRYDLTCTCICEILVSPYKLHDCLSGKICIFFFTTKSHYTFFIDIKKTRMSNTTHVFSYMEVKIVMKVK